MFESYYKYSSLLLLMVLISFNYPTSGSGISSASLLIRFNHLVSTTVRLPRSRRRRLISSFQSQNLDHSQCPQCLSLSGRQVQLRLAVGGAQKWKWPWECGCRVWATLPLQDVWLLQLHGASAPALLVGGLLPGHQGAREYRTEQEGNYLFLLPIFPAP